MLSVTVVIPVYNGRSYIAEALHSIHSQTFQPTEVIIVDDCSSDASVATVAEWSNLNSPKFLLKVLSTERNSGSPAGPLNIGIAEAREDLIAVLEQDDVFMPTKLCRCLEYFLKHQDLTFVTHGASRLRNRRCFGSLAQKNFEQDPYVRRLIGHAGESLLFPDVSTAILLAVKHSMFPSGFPGLVFRKSAWEKAGGLPECYKVATDYAFLLALAQGGNGCYLPERLYQRRSHADCLSHNSSLSFLEVLTILQRHLESAPETLQIPGIFDAIIWRTIESAWNIAAFGYRQQAGRIVRKATELGGWSITRELQKQATLLMPIYRSIFMPNAVSSEATANAVVHAAEKLFALAGTRHQGLSTSPQTSFS